MSEPEVKRAKSARAERKKTDKAHFEARFPELVEELLQDCRTLYPDYDAACVERFKQVLEYNTIGGENNGCNDRSGRDTVLERTGARVLSSHLAVALLAMPGKLNRGLSVLDTYRHLVGDREPTAEEVTDCEVIGWCIELVRLTGACVPHDRALPFRACCCRPACADSQSSRTVATTVLLCCLLGSWPAGCPGLHPSQQPGEPCTCLTASTLL